MQKIEMKSVLFLLIVIYFISVTEGFEFTGRCWKWEGEGKYHKDRESVFCQVNGVCRVIMKSDGTVVGGCYQTTSCDSDDYEEFQKEFPGNHYQQCCETENCNLVPEEQLQLLKSQGVNVDGNGVEGETEGANEDIKKSSASEIYQLSSLIIILVVALVI